MFTAVTHAFGRVTRSQVRDQEETLRDFGWTKVRPGVWTPEPDGPEYSRQEAINILLRRYEG